MREGMKYFTETNFPILGLVLFVLAFVFIVIIQKMYSDEKIEKIANIPLRGDAE